MPSTGWVPACLSDACDCQSGGFQSPVLLDSFIVPPWPPQASCILQLVKHIQKLQAKDVPVAEEVSALFAGELNPVAPKAQKKVPVPEG